jgi:hypothetical protein
MDLRKSMSQKFSEKINPAQFIYQYKVDYKTRLLDLRQ